MNSRSRFIILTKNKKNIFCAPYQFTKKPDSNTFAITNGGVFVSMMPAKTKPDRFLIPVRFFVFTNTFYSSASNSSFCLSLCKFRVSIIITESITAIPIEPNNREYNWS